MAAVAGSKGRIRLTAPARSSARFVDQASIAADVLGEKLSSRRAASFLLERSGLREVGVDTNMVCNLKCTYCYLNDREEEKGTLDLGVSGDFLETCVSSGAKLIAFIGKEPLADKRALTIARHLKTLPLGKKFRTGMVTNGTLIKRRLAQLSEANLDYLDVSLDGFSEQNDFVRGEGAFDAAIQGLRAASNANVASDLAVTSVLHMQSQTRYVEFASEMFDIGVTTCFSSPVLNFATSNTRGVLPLALHMDAVVRHYERLAGWASKQNLTMVDGRQILVDLPYRYSWMMLSEGRIEAKDVFQDAYEAHYWQPDSAIPVFVKLNFLPQSYWRAFRMTHDGRLLLNMDLAAHRDYRAVSDQLDDGSRAWWSGGHASEAHDVLSGFFDQILGALGRSAPECDRELDGQFRAMRPLVAA
jgi:uncharacterized Fe-S cluster-containing radical SAM superfamily protein